jgi:hypothetical protein
LLSLPLSLLPCCSHLAMATAKIYAMAMATRWQATKRAMAKGKGKGGKSDAYGDEECNGDGSKIDGNSTKEGKG